MELISWCFDTLWSVVFFRPYLLLPLVIIIRLLYNKFQPGLYGIPGPRPASYTNLWRVYDVAKGHAHLTALANHDKYGPVVRTGPRHISISDPALIPVIYGTNGKYTKSGFYPLQAISWQRKPAMNLFSTRDEDWHRAEKRKVASTYTVPNLLLLEGKVDEVIGEFVRRLDEVAEGGKKGVDLGDWVEYLAFDVVAEMAYGRNMGFLEKGEDVDGVMKENQGFLMYASVIGQIPWAHKFLISNPLLARIMRPMEDWNPVLLFTKKCMTEDAEKQSEAATDSKLKRHDMLTRWRPTLSNERDMVVHMATNLFAGTDTTSIGLRAIIYFLCCNRDCMKSLIDEIDSNDKQGRSGRPISYKEATTHFPYLEAVIKEAMRLHPSIALPFERHVPPEGLEVQGYHISAGTIVGINPYVTHRSPVFGADVEAFKPERWLNASREQLREMENLWEFMFGAGSRKCMGRNMALLQIYKVIPELFRHFRVELVDADKPLEVSNYWMVQQKGLICKVTKR